MRCPKCGKEITEPVQQCPNCDFAFNQDIYKKIGFFLEIKQKMAKVQTGMNNLASELKDLEENVGTYETLLEKDFDDLYLQRSQEIEAKEPGKEEIEPEIAAEPEETAAETQAAGEEKIIAEKSPKRTAEKEILFGQKWLLVIGIITIVFAVGFFLKYSFEKGWIGPAGRVALAYLLGIGFLVAGNYFQKKKYTVFGLCIFGGGISVLYFATYAAFQVYHLLSQGVSFLLMILITILTCLVAIIYNNRFLAILGLIGGFLTPLLMSTGSANHLALLSYMTILNLGIFAVAFFKRWQILTVLGFIATYLLYTGWFFNYYSPTVFWIAVIFINIFYLIYNIMPFLYDFLRERAIKLRGFFILGFNSLFAFLYSFFMIKEEFSVAWASIVSVAYAFTFLLFAQFLYQRGVEHRYAFPVFLDKAALFLVITIPLIFSHHWVTIFWTTQAFILLLMGIKLNRLELKIGSYLLMSVSIIKLYLSDLNTVFRYDLDRLVVGKGFDYRLGERYLTLVFVLAVLYVFFNKIIKKVHGQMSPSPLSSFLWGVWGSLLFITITLEVSVFFSEINKPAQLAALSILWTIFSIVLMLLGFDKESVRMRITAICLFLFTLGKIFFIDIADVSTPYRILSFFILGVILLVSSYLYYRFKDKILASEPGASKEE
jgi:uncharacterized membrane protein